MQLQGLHAVPTSHQVETLNYLLVGPGPNNNFRVKFEIHYVRDANGNIRVDRYDYEVFCR